MIGCNPASLVQIIRNRRFQPAWQQLHRFSLVAMNFWASDFNSTGELEALQYVESRLRSTPKPVIFDVGANVGAFSLACLKIVPQCDLHAFEPSRATFERLSALVPNDRVHLHNVGFSDQPRETNLYSSETGSTIASVYKLDRPIRPFRDEFTERVQLTTIDSFCRDRELRQIDFLKLDIEGHELSALNGAEAMLKAGAIRFIQFEFGENSLSARTYLSDFVYLLGARYDFFRIVPGGPVPWRYNGGTSEVFATMNYLCECRNETA